MKLRDMTIKIISPLALTAAGPFATLLNEIADRERAELEAQVEKRRHDENRQYEAEYYGVPAEMLLQLDEAGIPWRGLVAAGPLPNNGVQLTRRAGEIVDDENHAGGEQLTPDRYAARRYQQNFCARVPRRAQAQRAVVNTRARRCVCGHVNLRGSARVVGTRARGHWLCPIRKPHNMRFQPTRSASG